MHLSEIAKNLKTQDNLAARHPLYCVYQKRPMPIDDYVCGYDVQEIWVDTF